MGPVGFFDRLTGTKYPDSGVPPLASPEVRAALLALNGAGNPYLVRNARPAEKADLVVDWRMPEPGAGSSYSTRRREQSIKTRIRLDASRREARAVDEWRKVVRVGNPPGLTVGREHGRGPVNMVYREWTYERGPDGRRRRVEAFRFDSREVKVPLQEAVLGAGWTWRGVVFGRL
ncbi:hypothetical protein ABZ484_05520 [Streptomyces sp. NPDC006393]|uniref:hypothetical protein n=1 Tax=Streptomyces sp. NPDC006393 TaxID=3156763 RepID=UPI0033CED143